MTIAEARNSIGKRFTLNFIKLPYNKRADVIKEVKEDGTVIGDFLEAPADSIRLIADAPDHLLKINDEGKNKKQSQ